MTSREETATAVRGAIGEVLGVDPAQLGDATNLETDYAIDSLELMEIGTRLEAALGTRLKLEDLAAMRTVGDAIDVLDRRTGRQS